MAKLEGVKVVDMVDGEATKIAYEGEEYEMTEERAQVGDVIFNIKESSARYEHSYYKVVEIDNYARVLDENGLAHGWSHNTQGSNYVVYRNVTPQQSLPERVSTLETTTASLETRVDALEKDGPTSAKVYDKPAQVGGTIRITDAHLINIGDDYNNGDVMTVGKRYELTKDGVLGDIKKGERVVVTSDGEYRVDRIDARNRDFDYVNAEDLAEIKPGEGDIVRVTGTTNGHDVGTIGVVTGVRYDGVMSVRAMYNGSMSTFIEHHTELVALKEERSDV